MGEGVKLLRQNGNASFFTKIELILVCIEESFVKIVERFFCFSV